MAESILKKIKCKICNKVLKRSNLVGKLWETWTCKIHGEQKGGVIKNKTMKYKLEMKFNGETFTKETDNIKEAMLSMKPDIVHTEGYIKITKGTYIFQRRLDLVKLRKLFSDPTTLEIFTSTLVF